MIDNIEVVVLMSFVNVSLYANIEYVFDAIKFSEIQ